MAQPFLRKIAEHFLAQHGQELYRYRFVFHNQRAGIFLCHYIEQAAEGSVVLMPECTTVNSLLRRRLHYSGGEDPNSDLFVIHSIYLAYLRVMGLRPEERSFEDFYDLGTSLLHDFDDIDKHLVDVDPFIKNLIDHKELEEPITEYLSKRQWDAVTRLIYGDSRELPQPQPGDPEESDRLKKSFLDFWMKLPALYRTTRELLREERLAYEGMMLREAVGQINAGELDLTEDGMITVFVGLNAQTPAMYRILDHFRDSGRALFYWDYFTEPILRSPDLAGSFAKKNTSHYPSPTGADQIDFDIPQQRDELRTALIPTPSSVAQTSAIGKFLSDDPKEGQWSEILNFLSPEESAPLYDPEEPLRTAVVLPDENLLLPLLSNLPERVDQINVTMGYPIKGIPSAAMISALLKSWDHNYQRKGTYRLREVIDILRLSALGQLFADPTVAEERSRLEDHLLREKMYFASGEEICRVIEEEMPSESRAREVLLTIFTSLPITPRTSDEEVAYPSGEALTTLVLRLLDLLIPEGSIPEQTEDKEEEEAERQVDTDTEILRYIRRSIIRPQIDSQQSYRSRHPEEADRLFTFPVVRDLLRTTIARARVPFSGEPLQGMQIMGILETRGLDFDTILIPDASEGILPSATLLDTTIPFSLRKAYGLPSTDLQEQTRAYNFFRLMARARRVVFLYDSRTSDTSTGEPSRYVQLLRDIYEIPMLEVEASYDLTAQVEAPSFEPDQELIKSYREALRSRKRHLSATLMKDFHTCPQRFYYTAIVGLRDEENISGLMDARDSGNVFHRAMNLLYAPYEGRQITESELTDILSGSLIDAKVSESAQMEHYRSAEHSYNGTQIDIARKLVRRMVEADLERVREHGPLTYIGGEKMMTLKYEGVDFKLIIDRLDMQGDDMHVIDYKTGRDEYEWKLILPAEETPIEDNFRDAKPINGAILQLLYYCDILRRCHPEIDGQRYSYARLHPHILKPHDPEIGKEEIQIRYRFAEKKGKNYTGPVSLTELAEELPQLIDQLRGAVRLIQDPDFDFTVEEGHKDACKYCPAASVCDKYTS